MPVKLFIIILAAVFALFLLNAVLALIVYRVLSRPFGKNVLGAAGGNSGENQVGFDYEELSITSTNGKRLNAFFVGNDSDLLVVILHGYGNCAGGMIQYIDHFNSSGYNVLVPDLRGHGKSEGTCGFGYNDAADILKWIEELEKLKATHYRKVLFGTSMGAATAVNVALNAGDMRFDALIADSMPPDFFTIIEKVYHWRVKYPWVLIRPFLFAYIKLFDKLTEKELAFNERIRQLNVPVLFVHGKSDGLIDYRSVEKIYEQVQCKKDIILSENAEHTGMVRIEPDRYWNKVDEFIIENQKREEEVL